MQFYKRAFSVGLTGTVVVASLLATTRAEADTPATNQLGMQETTISQIVSGPDANGIDSVLLSSGQTISMPDSQATHAQQLRAAQAGQVSPDNSISGPCGSSYIYLYERSDGTPVRMVTGFNLSGGRRAISYGWGASITGPKGSGYAYDYSASGDLAFRTSWQGSHNSHTAYARGDYFAYAYSDSYALLDNGDICTSLEPYQETFL